MTCKIAPFLLLQRFQVLGCTRAALIDHKLCQRGEVPDHSKAVILEICRNTLEVRVPLFLRTEQHLEWHLLVVHAMKNYLDYDGQLLVYR